MEVHFHTSHSNKYNIFARSLTRGSRVRVNFPLSFRRLTRIKHLTALLYHVVILLSLNNQSFE